MALQFQPIIVAGGLGAADEYLENRDVAQGNTQNQQQMSFWYEVALLGIPAFMEVSGQASYGLRWLTDPALLVGSALLGRRASKWIRAQTGTPSGYGVPVARGYSAPMALGGGAPLSAFVNKQPSVQLV